ncbi:hypothetical protein T265_04582 [Opisthorchis viverrini]|uniref:DUF4200 domain-containing protein n=1 Tax=Opisthorchis viverrini TaxID=6198 RepID=A0A074ZZA6_OPIVI|nr:hypothetical protein T265_04582 [Opisthorchis viverrini]KER28630.1 hypothetical protein T265_04582 [Opisthorchis viverrini]
MLLHVHTPVYYEFLSVMDSAEQEARKRSAIVDEIRQLSVQQQKLTAENNRLRSVVQEYRGYKQFLECLVPEPHRSGRQLIRQERRLAKARAREEARRKLTIQPPLSVPPDIRRRPSFMMRRKSTLRPPVTSKSPTSVSSSPRTPRAFSSIDEEHLDSSSDESVSTTGRVTRFYPNSILSGQVIPQTEDILDHSTFI